MSDIKSTNDNKRNMTNNKTEEDNKNFLGSLLGQDSSFNQLH